MRPMRLLDVLYDWSSARRRRRRPSAVHRQRPPQSTTTPVSLFDAATSPEALAQAFDRLRRGGRAPGLDWKVIEDFGPRERAECLERLSRSLHGGRFQPSEWRTITFPKKNGGRRTLHLRPLLERTLASAVKAVVEPIVEPLFSWRSMGFRPRQDRLRLLMALERDARERNWSFVATDDVRAAFDHFNHEYLLQDVQRVLQDERLFDLIRRLTFDEGRRNEGVDQGSPLSPLLFNTHVHFRLDSRTPATRDAPSWFRFADDLTWLTQDATEGEAARETARRLLAEVGLSLKGGTRATDVRQEDVPLMGFLLRSDGNRFTYEVPHHKWAGLGVNLQECHLRRNPTAAARRAIGGWVEAHAPAFENAGVDVAVRLTEAAVSAGFREAVTVQMVTRWIQSSCRFPWQASLGASPTRW